MTTPVLLDPRAATRCAVRIQYDVLPPAGITRAIASSTSQSRMEEATARRDQVLAELAALHPESVTIAPGEDATEETLAAMKVGKALILRPRLPEDAEGGRLGSPPVLIYDGDGYVPVEIRLHGTTTHDAKKSVQVSTLAAPTAIEQRDQAAWKSDRLYENALPLAHYTRILEHHGLASSRRRGAVIDRALDVVWVDLEIAGTKVAWADEVVSWSAVYDREFAIRADVAAHAHSQRGELSPERKALPLAIKDCDRCPWNASCSVELEAQDHISLIPGFKPEWHPVFVDRGVTTRKALAALDHFTARATTELTATMLRKVNTASDDELLSDLLQVRDDLVAELAATGIVNAGQLRDRLHPVTAAFAGTAPGRSLTGHLDNARAATTGGHHRARGAAPLDLPVAAIEIDVDMESSASSHVYLWGALPTIDGELGDYVPFDSYDPMDDAAAASVFVRFWDWLAEQRSRAAEAGGVLRIYHWAPAELTAMRTIVKTGADPRLPTAEQIEAVIKAEWIDLFKVWRAQVLTGTDNGLKTVATSIGFTWDVDDAGGDFSMLQHDLAVTGSPAERERAIAWLRGYNGSDVRATYEVRRWLRKNAVRLPRIEDWKGSVTD